MRRRLTIVVMGVAGAGKTTLGRALATRLGLPFVDADDYHPAANIAKMAGGKPLSDADRQPWLGALAELMLEAQQTTGLVLACSALKQHYRDCLAASRLVFMQGTREILASRLAQRSGHFMGAHMLDSQLEILEPPTHAIVVDVALDTDSQVRTVLEQLAAER